MKIAKYSTLLHSMHAQIKELEDLSREAQSECNRLETRHASLLIEVRNAESNLEQLEQQRVRLEAELKELASKKKASA